MLNSEVIKIYDLKFEKGLITQIGAWFLMPG
jgi:hypothetical protein